MPRNQEEEGKSASTHPPRYVRLSGKARQSVLPQTQVRLAKNHTPEDGFLLQWSSSSWYAASLYAEDGVVSKAKDKEVLLRMEVFDVTESEASPVLISLNEQKKIMTVQYYFFAEPIFTHPGKYLLRFSAESKKYPDIAEYRVSVTVSDHKGNVPTSRTQQGVAADVGGRQAKTEGKKKGASSASSDETHVTPGTSAAAPTTTSKKRKRDRGGEEERRKQKEGGDVAGTGDASEEAEAATHDAPMVAGAAGAEAGPSTGKKRRGRPPTAKKQQQQQQQQPDQEEEEEEKEKEEEGHTPTPTQPKTPKTPYVKNSHKKGMSHKKKVPGPSHKKKVPAPVVEGAMDKFVLKRSGARSEAEEQGVGTAAAAAAAAAAGGGGGAGGSEGMSTPAGGRGGAGGRKAKRGSSALASDMVEGSAVVPPSPAKRSHKKKQPEQLVVQPKRSHKKKQPEQLVVQPKKSHKKKQPEQLVVQPKKSHKKKVRPAEEEVYVDVNEKKEEEGGGGRRKRKRGGDDEEKANSNLVAGAGSGAGSANAADASASAAVVTGGRGRDSGRRGRAAAAAAAVIVETEGVGGAGASPLKTPKARSHKAGAGRSAARSRSNVKEESVVVPVYEPPSTTVILSSAGEYRVTLSPSLMSTLLRDWEAVTKEGLLVNLPRTENHTVRDILVAFQKTLQSKDSTGRRAIDLLLASFDGLLGHALLYQEEKAQFKQLVTRHPHSLPSDLYGPEHLVRLLMALPRLLLPIQQVKASLKAASVQAALQEGRSGVSSASGGGGKLPATCTGTYGAKLAAVVDKLVLYLTNRPELLEHHFSKGGAAPVAGGGGTSSRRAR